MSGDSPTDRFLHMQTGLEVVDAEPSMMNSAVDLCLWMNSVAIQTGNLVLMCHPERLKEQDTPDAVVRFVLWSATPNGLFCSLECCQQWYSNFKQLNGFHPDQCDTCGKLDPKGGAAIFTSGNIVVTLDTCRACQDPRPFKAHTN